MFYSEEAYQEMEDERLGIGEAAYYVGGVPCASSDEACRVAGILTPAEQEAEDEYLDELWRKENPVQAALLDKEEKNQAMEARRIIAAMTSDDDDDDIPF